MLLSGNHLKVAHAVVAAIAVSVMDVLVLGQLSAKVALHDGAMFEHLSSGDVNLAVLGCIWSAALEADLFLQNCVARRFATVAAIAGRITPGKDDLEFLPTGLAFQRDALALSYGEARSNIPPALAGHCAKPAPVACRLEMMPAVLARTVYWFGQHMTMVSKRGAR